MIRIMFKEKSMVEYSSFRNQAEAKAPWVLDEDARRGLNQSVNNNQPQMALYYVVELIKEYDALVAELRAEIAKLRKEITNKTTAPKATAATKKAEDTTEG